jgi:hypothetical protein
MLRVMALFSVALCSSCLQAEVAPGHWEGSIKLPLKQARVAVDLSNGEDGLWSGTITFPEVGNSAVKFDTITLDGTTVVLMSKACMCMIRGELSADGRVLDGEFVSAVLHRVPVAVQMKWVGKSNAARPLPSGAISKEMVGNWSGDLMLGKSWEGDDEKPLPLQFRVVLARNGDGIGTGIYTSVFNASQLEQVSSVTQQGTTVRLEMDGVAAVYVGQYKDGHIVGRWSQFNHDPVDLTLRRTAKSE